MLVINFFFRLFWNIVRIRLNNTFLGDDDNDDDGRLFQHNNNNYNVYNKGKSRSDRPPSHPRSRGARTHVRAYLHILTYLKYERTNTRTTTLRSQCRGVRNKEEYAPRRVL